MSKRTRAQTRRKKKRARGSRPTLSTNPAEANRVLDDLIRSIDVVPVETFPGGCHETLAHPDRVKFELGMFVKETPTALSKLNQLEADYARGKLSFVSRIGHWALERFLWHGLPSDSWHPIEAFLKDQGDRFPEPARQQLRRWKEAELNIFEIGSLRDDFTVALRPWDLHESKPAGSWFHAIDLSMGGVNVYQDREGYLKLNWLAPWAPEENLFCAMGYGMTASKGRAAELFLPRLTSSKSMATRVLGGLHKTSNLSVRGLRRWNSFGGHTCEGSAAALTEVYADSCS